LTKNVVQGLGMSQKRLVTVRIIVSKTLLNDVNIMQAKQLALSLLFTMLCWERWISNRSQSWSTWQ